MGFVTPEEARTMSQPDKFGDVPLFNIQRLAHLKDQIDSGTLSGRPLQKWNAILALDNTAQPEGPIDPFNPPPYYEDPIGSEEFSRIWKGDGSMAVDFGIRWQMQGNVFDAQAAARMIAAWSNLSSIVQNGDARLLWSNGWPLYIEAANLIKDSPAFTAELAADFAAQTVRGLNYSTAYIQTENRAAWGLVLEMSAASYLADRPRLLRAMARWRELFTVDVVNNELPGEIARGVDGLYYCNFWLNAMTQAAEIARFNGEWLYDFELPDGSTLRGIWEKVSYWTAEPTEYPYWDYTAAATVRIQAYVDPLHVLWPNEYSQTLIDTYTTTQDYVGLRAGMLAWRGLPLYG